jgi:hypothetical protein
MLKLRSNMVLHETKIKNDIIFIDLFYQQHNIRNVAKTSHHC